MHFHYFQVVHFVNSGSDANDLALMMARLYTKRNDVVSFRFDIVGIQVLTALSVEFKSIMVLWIKSKRSFHSEFISIKY